MSGDMIGLNQHKVNQVHFKWNIHNIHYDPEFVTSLIPVEASQVSI